MATKITITLTQDDKDGSDAAMQETIAALTTLGIVPAKKLVLTLECEPEDADTYREDIKVALANRPVGVDVTLKTTTEEDVQRQRMARVTPMDKAWAN